MEPNKEDHIHMRLEFGSQNFKISDFIADNTVAEVMVYKIKGKTQYYNIFVIGWNQFVYELVIIPLYQ